MASVVLAVERKFQPTPSKNRRDQELLQATPVSPIHECTAR